MCVVPGVARQRYRAFLSVSDNTAYAPRDLSFIEIVTAWSAARSRLFHIIERRDVPRRCRGGNRRAADDRDGPLRDAFANRDINTKRSFIFFYAPFCPDPDRDVARPRILTRPTRATPMKILAALPDNVFSPASPVPLARSRIRSYEFTLEFPRTIYVAEPPLASTAENFMTTSCSLYIRVPPIRATPSN